MEEESGHCSHLTCASRGFPVTNLDRTMGSPAEGILGKSGSGGPPSLGMAPSVWGLVNHPLQRLLKSSHSATASEKHPVLPHNHRFSIHRQRMEHSRKLKLPQAGNQEPAGSSAASAIRGPGITQEDGEGEEKGRRHR